MTILVKATKYICYVLLVFGYCCGAIILINSNPQNPGEPRGFSRWGPHSPGFKFFGELQTLRKGLAQVIQIAKVSTTKIAMGLLTRRSLYAQVLLWQSQTGHVSMEKLANSHRLATSARIFCRTHPKFHHRGFVYHHRDPKKSLKKSRKFGPANGSLRQSGVVQGHLGPPGINISGKVIE